MKKFLLGAACGIVCLPSIAADTWVVSGVSKTLLILYDQTTMEINKNIRGTWTVTVWPTNMEGLDYVLGWQEFDCKNKKSRLTMGYPGIFGKSLGKQVLKSATKWDRIPPGSVLDDTLVIVCAKEPAKGVSLASHEEAAKLGRGYLRGYLNAQM